VPLAGELLFEGGQNDARGREIEPLRWADDDLFEPANACRLCEYLIEI